MIHIIADSTCDLSKELVEKYGIIIQPLYIHLGEEEYQDGVSITPDDIYKWSEETKETPKTAAVSMAEMIDLYEKYTTNGDEIICFSISDDMSTTGNVMRMAAEEMDATERIHVINSANLSTGIGLLVIEAAIMAQNGVPAKDIVAKIEELKPLVRSSFVVDILTYLHRGGRCSGVAALAGGMLKLHPRIAVEDGKMGPGKKYRGRMNSVILEYVKDMEEDLKMAKADRVFITHSGCDEAIIDEVRAYLEQLHVFDEILVTRAGGVISSHCGPGTLGVLFIAG
ncbi:MAG: DegV family protein [Lachnospiraceae bacterium]|nr:DegV family protein [Lachnospiraceae bacterium]